MMSSSVSVLYKSPADDEWTVVGNVDDHATMKLRPSTLDVLHGADSVAAAREASVSATERETHMVALPRGRLIADMCRGQAPSAAVDAARAPGGHAAALQLLHDDTTWAKVEAQFARDAPRQDLIVCGAACSTGAAYKAAVRRALNATNTTTATDTKGTSDTTPTSGFHVPNPFNLLSSFGWLGTSGPTPPGQAHEGAYRLAVALAQQQSLVPLYEGVRAQFDASAGGALLIAEVGSLDRLPRGASRRAVIHVRETIAGSGRFVVEVHKWLRVLRPNSTTARNGHTLLLVRAVLTCPLDQADPAVAAKAQYDADAFLEWRLVSPSSAAAVPAAVPQPLVRQLPSATSGTARAIAALTLSPIAPIRTHHHCFCSRHVCGAPPHLTVLIPLTLEQRELQRRVDRTTRCARCLQVQATAKSLRPIRTMRPKRPVLH